MPVNPPKEPTKTERVAAIASRERTIVAFVAGEITALLLAFGLIGLLALAAAR